MQTRAQLLSDDNIAAVYHMAHRLTCIALAAKEKPLADAVFVRKQVGRLKREACQLLRDVQ